MIKPPIVCIEGDDIMAFASQEYAENWLEVPIVQSGDAGEVYDADGHILIMDIGFKECSRSFLWFKWQKQYESVVIRKPEKTNDYTSELRDKLTAYLIRRGVNSNELLNNSLKQLIIMVGGFMPWKKQFKTIDT